MDLVCVGLNHKTCPVAIREKIAFSSYELSAAFSKMKETVEMRESFLLSTCNRVELYGRGPEGVEASLIRFLSDYHGIEPEEIHAFLYRFSNRDAARHLFRVASGLDSLVVGENEIYGQVKNAFRIANEIGTVDSILYQLIERSLRVGKRVRSETKINEGAVSVSSIAVELAEKIFGRLTHERILILGTGKMSALTVKNLVKSGVKDITVTSRTFERALELAQKFGAKPIGFDEWRKALRTSDIVISSTAAPHPIVKYEDVAAMMKERKGKPLFFIDIAVPRDVDSRAGTIDDVYLYDIDDLKSVADANLRLRKKEISKCEAIIERELESFDQWHQFLEAGPVVERLNAYFDDVIEAEIAQAAKKFRGREEELHTLVQRIKAKLLHQPIEKLKDSARDGSLERYMETLYSLFHLEKDSSPPEPKKQDSSPLPDDPITRLAGRGPAEESFKHPDGLPAAD